MMRRSRFPIRIETTPRSLELKRAVLASFTLEPDVAFARLHGFREADWLSILWWLDISGLAIYFYARACDLGAQGVLPRSLEAGLSDRLKNNRERMNSLLKEAHELAEWLEGGNVPYAFLKGVTLTPHSVQESALRCQTDLDVLVAGRSADLATHYIRRLGYRLHAQSGRTLEFRAGAPSRPDLANLYSAKAQRALELHLTGDPCCENQWLSRRVPCRFEGLGLYALSGPDILVQQAIHLLKHLCGEHTRISWALEFWRHIRNRQGDCDFWRRAEASAAESTHGDLAMGVAVWVAEELFGCTHVPFPAQWRGEALPLRVRLWLERYMGQLLLSDTVGNKLYALLKREVPGATQEETRTTGQILLPRVLPAPVLKPQPNESSRERCARYFVEAEFIMRRTWFHVRENIRFAIEASRWNRAVARIGR